MVNRQENQPKKQVLGRRLVGIVRRPGWTFWVAFLLFSVCFATFVSGCLTILYRAHKLAQIDHGINSAITELQIARARQAVVGQTIVELAGDGQQEMPPAWRSLVIHFQRHSQSFQGSIQEALARIRMEGRHEAELKTLESQLCTLEELQERVQNDVLTIVRLTDEGRSDDIAVMHVTIEESRAEAAEQLENLSNFIKITSLNSAKQIQHMGYRVFWSGIGSILMGGMVSILLWKSCRRGPSIEKVLRVEGERQEDLMEIPAEQALTERFLLRGVHVLVAEDDANSRRLLARVFENAGAVVTVACDGGHALQQFNKASSSGHPVQLIIIDLRMPVMDGLQVVTQLREVHSFEGPVLALTAMNSPDVRMECIAAGFDDYLSKPIDRKRLLQIATDYLGKSIPA